MIRPLAGEKEIDEAFSILVDSATKGGNPVQSVIGYQGGSENATLTWHSDVGVWILAQPERFENRFWCAFGTEDPTAVSMVSIVCEINPPRIGINRQCAGLFIRDSTGSVYLAHSGKIGGGRAGVGKAAFMRSVDKNDVVPVVFPNGQQVEYIVIGRIDDNDFLADLTRFVHAVAEFKKAAVKGGHS